MIKSRTIYVDEKMWDQVKKRARKELGLSMSAYISLLLRMPIGVGDTPETCHFHMSVVKDKNMKKKEIKKKQES